MSNTPLLIVILILFVVVTLLWGLVNYMKGREQIFIMLIKSMGMDAQKAMNELKMAKKKQEKSE